MPFCINGDMLTIDVTHPEGERQPVTEDVQGPLDHGARRDIRDKAGERPFDIAHREASDLRAMLQ